MRLLIAVRMKITAHGNDYKIQENLGFSPQGKEDGIQIHHIYIQL